MFLPVDKTELESKADLIQITNRWFRHAEAEAINGINSIVNSDKINKRTHQISRLHSYI